MNHPNALAVEEQPKPDKQSSELGTLVQGAAGCHGSNHFYMWAGTSPMPAGWPCQCGLSKYEPKLYSQSDVDRMLKAHTEALLSAVEAELVDQYIHHCRVIGSENTDWDSGFNNGVSTVLSEQRQVLNNLKERYS